jgi:hypothetical protein
MSVTAMKGVYVMKNREELKGIQVTGGWIVKNLPGIMIFTFIFFASCIPFSANAQKISGGQGQGNVLEMGQGYFTAGKNGFTSNYGMGTHSGRRFIGVRITQVKPNVTRLQIRYQGKNGAVIYDGPVRPGQFISLPTRNLTVTGWVSGGGNYYNAVKYVRCWR